MDEQQAIEELRKIYIELNDCNKYPTFEVAFRDMEMQIPKVIQPKRWCSAYCPNCKTELSEHHGDGYHTYPTYLKMCPECGQKIQWDESEI